jgi:hypothetical protein
VAARGQVFLDALMDEREVTGPFDEDTALTKYFPD